MTNQIYTISPYVRKGVWVFDDEERGLQHEALIAGIDMMLDRVAELFPDGFVMHFSSDEFPTRTHRLIKVIDDDRGGTWYRCPELDDMEGWLCPALLRYYKAAPSIIYIGVTAPREKRADVAQGQE